VTKRQKKRRWKRLHHPTKFWTQRELDEIKAVAKERAELFGWNEVQENDQ
jgi:hypothetical protein